MAGVIGGEATGCDESTRTVFLECALFDPVRVALTGRRHQVVSDARQRFERGIDPAMMPAAVEAATCMVLDLCGGEPGAVVSGGRAPDWRRSATLRFERLAGLGGLDMPPDEAVAALQRLGFAVERRDAAQVTVSVPSWRNDVASPWAGGAALDQAPDLDPAAAAKAAEGCALIEPECDLSGRSAAAARARCDSAGVDAARWPQCRYRPRPSGKRVRRWLDGRSRHRA